MLFFWQHTDPLQGLSGARDFSHCTLSGSRADGFDKAAPELRILEDGCFPAWGNQLEDLPQSWPCWEPPAAAQ